MARPTVKAVLLSPQRPLGDKPLLVVGPSLGTSSVLWTQAGALLGDDFDVVAWDLPGHGVSPAATETFDVAELADAVVELVDSIAPGERFHYAGRVPWRGHRTAAGHQARRTPQEPLRAVLRRQAGHARRLAGAGRNRPQPGHPGDDPGFRATLVRARIHGARARAQQPPAALPARRRPLQLRVLLRSPGRLRRPRGARQHPRPHPGRGGCGGRCRAAVVRRRSGEGHHRRRRHRKCRDAGGRGAPRSGRSARARCRTAARASSPGAKPAEQPSDRPRNIRRTNVPARNGMA